MYCSIQYTIRTVESGELLELMVFRTWSRAVVRRGRSQRDGGSRSDCGTAVFHRVPRKLQGNWK